MTFCVDDDKSTEDKQTNKQIKKQTSSQTVKQQKLWRALGT